jgi:hypothetical protein
MKVNISNQCSDFKLIGLKYLNSGAQHNGNFAREVDAGSIMSFELTPFRAMFEGALICKLQRKHVKPGNRPEPTDILLLMAWNSEGYKKFRVLVHLIECNKRPYWGLTEPEEYYQRLSINYAHILILSRIHD